ncbi:MAG: hypothetical protein L3J65_04325 [Robiginitomaculum sp.]|nr:hypothetical protein [Robiginitomaculum sp.]
MHTSEMAMKGYKTTQKHMGSDIELELKIFTDITGRLAGADVAKPGGISELAEAVQDNARLWNLIFLDLTSADNQLEQTLKSGLIYLAEFTRQHTTKVLQGEARPNILIEINKNIISGKRDYFNRAAKVAAA